MKSVSFGLMVHAYINTVVNTACSQQPAQPASAKSTDAREKFQFETSLAPNDTPSSVFQGSDLY